MMTAMRENMPLIMWILVGAFLATIVFSWGMGGFDSGGQLDGVVGKVGNREIMYDQYNRMVQDRVAQQRQKDEKIQITDAQIRQLRKDVWDELVRNEIMDIYAEKWGLVTSDEEVAWAVRNSPPSWIRSNENFQKDGQFDPSIYEDFLRDPRSADILVAIEKDYRASIGYQKVIDRVIAPVFVTPDEAWDDFIATNRKFNALVVSFSNRDFQVDSTTITEDDIRTYYTDHRNDYQRPEQCKLAYVSFPVIMTKEDSNRILESAQEILRQARNNEDFAELATEFSEDEGSAQRGGDLGYFTSGRMVKEFDSTAFATAPGTIADPVFTRFGIHIIKVVDRKAGAEGDSVRASHILLKWNVGAETEERVAQRAKDFTDAAKSDSWKAAADQMGLEIQETEAFQRNPSGNIPGFGSLLPVMDFAFASKPGAISYVYKTKVRGQDVYSVFQVRELMPESVAPLTDVESGIRSILIRQKQTEMAKQAAAQFRNQVSDESSFMAVAANRGLKVDTTGDHALRDYIRAWGTDEEIGKAVFALEPGQISQPLSNARGAYIALLLNKTDADKTVFEAQKQELVNRLRTTKQNNTYTDWLAEAKEDVGVQDKRYLYYTDY